MFPELGCKVRQKNKQRRSRGIAEFYAKKHAANTMFRPSHVSIALRWCWCSGAAGASSASGVAALLLPELVQASLPDPRQLCTRKSHNALCTWYK